MTSDAPRSRLVAARTMIGFAWRADQGRTLLTVALYALQAALAALFALWLKLLIDGVQAHRLAEAAPAAAMVAVSVAAGAGLDFAASRVRMGLNERVHHLVERRLIEAVGRTPTLEIQETPAHVAQLELLNGESWEFGDVIPSLVNLFATAVRVVVAALLLVTVSPLLLLLPLFGLPTLMLSPFTGSLFNKGNELAEEPSRRATDLFELATGSAGAKEVRVFRLAGAIIERFHRAQAEVRRIHVRLWAQGRAIGLGAQLIFLAGYVGAIAFSVERARSGRTGVGDVVMTAVLAGQVLGLITGSANMLQWASRTLRSAGRYVYLVEVAARSRAVVDPSLQIPTRLHDGIRLQGVSYHYPSAPGDALCSVDLHLPAGTTVAVVGENGAGKTTLVKLLAALYRPTAGTVTVDGVDLFRMDPDRWRERVSASFQDYARLEFLIREAVGVGSLDHLENRSEAAAALERAGAADLVPALPQGLETQLGPAWPRGVDLSGGQWQKVALGRAMMRMAPLLLLLDEPTAALDAETEHRLFNSWTGAARELREQTGAITVLVSHRFSTVRMADLILVLRQGRLVEQGDHAALMRRGGLYAELYTLQAAAYR